MKETYKCINCGTPLEGNFCSNCGQRRIVKRLSIKTFFEDYLSRLFGMDTNFLRTLRDLTISPGQVGNTFVGGNRVKYIGPVGYFFLISTFFILSFSLLGIDVKYFMTQASDSIVAMPSAEPQQENLQSSLMGVLSRNLKILQFLIIPFIALWGMVFFKKAKMNFFEHSVNALYIQGHLLFLKMIGVFVFKWNGFVINPYLIVVDVPYFIWSCFGFYELKGVKNVFKAGLLYLISFLSFLISIMVITIIGVVIYKKLLNP